MYEKLYKVLWEEHSGSRILQKRCSRDGKDASILVSMAAITNDHNLILLYRYFRYLFLGNKLPQLLKIL
jgi:hypothetical protein